MFYFYKITNLRNHKFYYGVHETQNLNDGYMGSGVAIKKAIIEEGIENFQKEIIKFFDTRREMLAYEAKIVTQDLVDDDNCYNLTTGGGGSSFQPFGLTAVVDKNGKRFMCKTDDENFLNGEYISLHKNLLLCKDKEGKFISVYKNDERIKNGILRPFNVSMMSVEDYNGNRSYVSCDDEKVKNGELISTSKGKFTAIDKTGNTHYISVDDERYRNNEFVGFMKNHTIVKSNNTNKVISVDDFKNGNYEHVNKGKIPTVDKNGKHYMVEHSDERYINGELIPNSKGFKIVTNGKETKRIPVNENIDGYQGVLKGKMAVIDKNGNKFMCNNDDERIKNGELVSVNKGKFLCIDKNGNILFVTKEDERYKRGELQALSKGKKYDDTHCQKLREARGDRIVVNNGKNLKFIHKNELDEYMQNGWNKGRLPYKQKGKSYYINNGILTKKVKESHLQDFLNNGWERGKIKKENQYVTKEELVKLLETKTFTEIGKMFGVTSGSVRFWCKNYDLPFNSRDYKKKMN